MVIALHPITTLAFLISTLANQAFADDFPTSRFRKPYGEQRAFSTIALPQAAQINMSGKNFVEVPESRAAQSQMPSSTFPVSATDAVSAAAASDIGPYLRSNSPLAESANLVSGGPFARLPSAMQQSLKSEHLIRTSERDAFLPEADAIDSLCNNRLDPWKKRLDMELAALEADAALYKQAEAAHRSRCMPARDQATWKWCLEDAKALKAWHGRLGKRGADYNDELARFHSESKPYDARLAALAAKIETWISIVEDLVKRIKRAIGETQSCTWTGGRYPPGDPNGLCVYNCTVSGITYIPINSGRDPDCPTLRIDVPVPPAGGAGAANKK